MKKIYILCFLVFGAVFLSDTVSAQRYLENVFTEVTRSDSMVYGVNASVLAYASDGEAVPQELYVEIYQPEGDTEEDRPLMIIQPTGNFLPWPVSGSPSGTMRDSTTVEWAIRLAKLGYVAAIMDYRIGWNPGLSPQEARTNSIINAAYRGLQDARTCIRWFRKEANESGNPYKIDPDKIGLWGQGTGGYISLGCATLDEYEEVLIPKFFKTVVTGTDTTFAPMVLEALNGDVNGVEYGINPADQDTFCYANYVDYTSEFNLAVNVGGACGDITWIDENSVPTISFQTTDDPFAPYTDGTVLVPIGAGIPVIDVIGSYLVQEKLDELGVNSVFETADLLSDPIHDIINARNDGFNGLCPFPNADDPFDSSPWDFWNSDEDDPNVNPNSMGGLEGNPDMSAEKARAYIDTIMAYFAPRGALAMGLYTEEEFRAYYSLPDLGIDKIDADISMYPNPAEERFVIQSGNVGGTINQIQVFAIDGRLVSDLRVNATNQYVMDVQSLDAGTYMIKVILENGVSSQKVVIK